MTPRKLPNCVVNNILMFKLWSDYHVYVSTITKKYLLGKSVVTYVGHSSSSYAAMSSSMGWYCTLGSVLLIP